MISIGSLFARSVFKPLALARIMYYIRGMMTHPLCGYDELGILGLVLLGFGLGWTVHWIGAVVIDHLFRTKRQ